MRPGFGPEVRSRSWRATGARLEAQDFDPRVVRGLHRQQAELSANKKIFFEPKTDTHATRSLSTHWSSTFGVPYHGRSSDDPIGVWNTLRSSERREETVSEDRCARGCAKKEDEGWMRRAPLERDVVRAVQVRRRHRRDPVPPRLRRPTHLLIPLPDEEPRGVPGAPQRLHAQEPFARQATWAADFHKSITVSDIYSRG